MSTNFPIALDAFTNPSGTDHLDDAPVLHSAQHTNINDAVEALQAKVGIDFSSTQLSLDFIARLLLMTQGNHPNGTYRELVYVPNSPIVDSVVWYTSAAKTIKLVEKVYTYESSVRILPTKVTLKLYDGTVANTLKRTIEDTISYNRVFETSRTRIIT